MVDFAWDPEYTNFSLALLWSVCGFALYYFLSRDHALAQKWSGKGEHKVQVYKVLIQRGWGFLFLGLIPLILVLLVFRDPVREYGIGFHFKQGLPWWSFLVIPFILVAAYFTSSSPGNLALYPQIRIKDWTSPVLAVSALSWILFLVGYEFLFRGFLLFTSVRVIGPWPAIALNCTLYAFAHFYKGPGETFGAVPMGVLLCYLSLLTGNIWSAVLIHSVMALSNEWMSIRAHPDMNIIRKR